MMGNGTGQQVLSWLNDIMSYREQKIHKHEDRVQSVILMCEALLEERLKHILDIKTPLQIQNNIILYS